MSSQRALAHLYYYFERTSIVRISMAPIIMSTLLLYSFTQSVLCNTRVCVNMFKFIVYCHVRPLEHTSAQTLWKWETPILTFVHFISFIIPT